MHKLPFALLGLLIACGGDSKKMPDAPTAPAMITIKGTTKDANPLQPKVLGNVPVAAFKASDDSMVAMTTSDAQGNYTLTITTNGVALDGYLKATNTGYLDTYLYPPKPVSADIPSAPMNMVTQQIVDLLSGTVCRKAQDTAKGLIGVMVIDTAGMPVAGAMVASSPAADKYCYDKGTSPDSTATMTDTDGIAYMINVTGDTTVSATGGATFMSHSVKARAGTLTTTQISE